MNNQFGSPDPLPIEKSLDLDGEPDGQDMKYDLSGIPVFHPQII
jgi:hypothetical protein